MRNNVPDGENVGEFRTSGVERAGGAGGEGLVEQLRERIRVLEQVPVSLAFPPAPDTGPLPRPACSLLAPVPSFPLPSLSVPANANPSPLPGEGSTPRAQIPWNRLAANGLHEIKPAAYRDTPSALAFALAFIGDRLTRRERASPLLWCLTERAAREWGAPYGPGLIAFGLDPALVLIVQTRNTMDAAWALEEGLKAGAFIAVLGQIEVKAPIIARRLGLAAQVSRTPCLLLSGHQGGGAPRHAHPLACRCGANERRSSSMPRRQGRQLGISRSSAAGAWRRREVGPWSFVMSRMVSVWLPALPIERLKLKRNGKPFPVDRPFALVGSEDRGLLLTALNAAAMREGLSPGMGLADARAIAPQLLTAPAALEKDAACLLALARWSGRYSPSLNVDGDDGLWLDVSGVPHLFGGARALLDDMARRFAKSRLHREDCPCRDLGRRSCARPLRAFLFHHRPPGKDRRSARAPSRGSFAD